MAINSLINDRALTDNSPDDLAAFDQWFTDTVVNGPHPEVLIPMYLRAAMFELNRHRAAGAEIGIKVQW